MFLTIKGCNTMNRYKRLFTLFLAFSLVLSMTFAGCKKNEEEPSSQPASSEASGLSQSSEAPQSSSESVASSQPEGPLPGTQAVSSSESSAPSSTAPVVQELPVCGKPGYYTAEESLVSLKVTTGNVLLQNKQIIGDLEITADAEHQPITLSDVTVGGKLIVRGGGIVTLANVSAPILYAQKEEEPIYLLLQDDLDIPQAMIGGEMIILDGGITSGGLQNVFLDQVDSDAPAGKSVLELQGIRISQLVVDQDSEVMLYEGASVAEVWANAPVSFKGTGKISTLNCTSSGVTYQTKPGKISLQEGVSAPTMETMASSSVVRIPTASESTSSGGTTTKYYVTKNGIRIYPLTPNSSSEGSASKRIDEPEIEVEKEGSKLSVSWDRVRNASGYRVELRSGLGTGKLLESAELEKSETTYRIDYEIEWDTDYTIRVKAYASGDYIDSGFAEKEYNSSAGDFGSPDDLKLQMVDGSLEAVWKSHDDADLYEVLLYDPEGEILEDTTTQFNYFWFEDVEFEEIGRYAVKVRAVNLSTGEYSAYASATYRISANDRKLDTPYITASFADDTLEVSWDWVDNAKDYTLRIRKENSGNYLRSNITASDNEYLFDSINFQKGTRYVVEVRANAESGYADSDFGSVTTDYYQVGW